MTGSISSEFTLGDLLDHKELGLELLTSDPAARAREVTGAHSTEVELPGRWLDRGWVLLTTGSQLGEDADRDRKFVADLRCKGISAIGFGVDVVHPNVPAFVLEEAERLDLAVFSVPLDTAFRDIVTEVSRNVLSSEIRSAGRLVAMQRFLMDSFTEESPRITVMRRLASLIEATVGVILPEGEVVMSTGRLPGAEIAAEVGSHAGSTVAFKLADLYGIALPIGDPRAPDTRRLIAAYPVGKEMHPLAKPTAQATVPLLVAINRLDRALESQDQAVRAASVEALLDAQDHDQAHLAAARVAACGVNVADGAEIVVVVSTSDEIDLPLLAPAIESRFGSPGPPLLAAVTESQIAILLPGENSEQLVKERILVADPSLRVGVGRTFERPIEAAQSRLDAELAISCAPGHAVGAIVRYEDLELSAVLVNEVPYERLAPKIRHWLIPLQQKDQIYETVVSYLDNNLDVGDTARALNLHPNSIRYRLSRAEEIIGAPLREPATLAALHIALNTDSVAFSNGGPKLVQKPPAAVRRAQS